MSTETIGKKNGIHITDEAYSTGLRALCGKVGSEGASQIPAYGDWALMCSRCAARVANAVNTFGVTMAYATRAQEIASVATDWHVVASRKSYDEQIALVIRRLREAADDLERDHARTSLDPRVMWGTPMDIAVKAIQAPTTVASNVNASALVKYAADLIDAVSEARARKNG